MSTLKTSNIQDTSGNNNSTPEEIGKGRAKAWVNFNGQGSISIRDSFNVSSLTDDGTGTYTLNFTNAMPNANYCFTGTSGRIEGVSSALNNVEPVDGQALSTSMTTTSLQVNVVYASSATNRTNVDRQFVNVIVFGD